MSGSRFSFLLSVFMVFGSPAWAEDYLVSTPKTSLLISAEKGKKCYFQYYGPRVEKAADIFVSGNALWGNSYPTFGLSEGTEHALAVTFADGSLSVDLCVESVKQYATSDGSVTQVNLVDSVCPIAVSQYFKSYNGTDVMATWTEISNTGRKPFVVTEMASAALPLRRADNWISHLSGAWAAEHLLQEERLTNGQKIVSNLDGVRNTATANPSVMITLDGQPREEAGCVVGASLAWSGNYRLKSVATQGNLTLFAGINPTASAYQLQPKETFCTPELVFTYSTEGKGGVSRAFHRWARRYALHNGEAPRDVLLNSWEGVYFGVNQEIMDRMMKDFAAIGGELFVMDDGWFGEKYPRHNDMTSLGDWEVCKEKLPQGIEGLLASAKQHHVKFGIWIEPEMANTRSELFEKHPEWVLSQQGRQLTTGRGGTQVVLDLTNPKVQDFVFGVVDRLMTSYPDIAYIKWDANACVMNYASPHLPAQKQSHLNIAYHQGLRSVLERIRQKYPHVVMQACASGGGRVNYGLLPYFDEFWTSDNTDAYQRIFMQWGVSSFFPAAAMASHVSAGRNHQTERSVPLKFRFDVAMSGRLGMEMQPKDLNESELDFARRAIAAYKEVRPVVQQGDLYRLISPYDKQGFASLMYATTDKSRAVLFVYKMEHLYNMNYPTVRLSGVDENKVYRLRDLTPRDAARPSGFDGKEVSGRVLKYVGLSLASVFWGEYASLALELTEVR